jgi:hypothetical protein
MGIVTEDAPHEALSPEQEVENLVKFMLPRLRRILVTPEMSHQYVCAVAAAFGLICSVMDGSVLLVNPDSEEEPSDEPEPSLEQDAPTPYPEPNLQHQDEPINNVDHTRFAGVRIAEPWAGYRQGQS